MVDVDCQVSATGSYRPPVFSKDPTEPPQRITTLPVHTAVGYPLLSGAPTLQIGSQVSVTGSYRPPLSSELPPQTTITVPVQTAVCVDLALGAATVDVGSHESATGS